MRMAEWFREQLEATGEGFVWSAEQVPVERRDVTPPRRLGEWTAARHVFHMAYYEKEIALPSMRQWAGGPPLPEERLDEDVAWGEGRTVEESLASFREVRAEEVALAAQLDEALWEETRETVWGAVTLLWVVSKTFQHTAEHINDVMRMALFWDRFAAREQERERESALRK